MGYSFGGCSSCGYNRADDLSDFPSLNEVPRFHEEFSYDDDYPPIPPIPPIPAEDADGLKISHLATLSTGEGLHEAVWAALPDALVERILTRLPPAAFARLRSLCKRWNELPSSPEWLQQNAEVARRPSCTVMCQLGIRARPYRCQLPSVSPSFFCHSEWSWFSMPPLGHSLLNWEIVDIDWGLVCYACYEQSALWLCVSNPLTKAKTVLPPPFGGSSRTSWDNDFAKFVVDRQTKTYKIVVLNRSSIPPSTLVYNSATAVWTVLKRAPALWTVLQSCPSYDPLDDRAGSCFLWKRTIFMPCGDPCVLQAFDLDTEVWRVVEIEWTGGGGMSYHFVSTFDTFTIIRSFDTLNLYNSVKPVSVGLLKEDSASPFPLFEDKFVEMDVNNRAYLYNVISVARCDISHNDCLIFTNRYTKQWITYTCKSSTWRDMPSRSDRNETGHEQYAWYDWEPRWDVGTGPDPSPILNIVA